MGLAHREEVGSARIDGARPTLTVLGPVDLEYKQIMVPIYRSKRTDGYLRVSDIICIVTYTSPLKTNGGHVGGRVGAVPGPPSVNRHLSGPGTEPG